MTNVSLKFPMIRNPKDFGVWPACPSLGFILSSQFRKCFHILWVARNGPVDYDCISKHTLIEFNNTFLLGKIIILMGGLIDMMEIIPAILAEEFKDCLKMVKQAESFTRYVQIDLMDGIFVPSRSFSGETINDIQTTIFFEIHLMVQDPQSLMARIRHPHLKQVIFHFESNVRYLDFVRQMEERGITTGMALNPGTQVNEFKEMAERVDTLLFLAVDPGAYGSPFKPEVLRKVEGSRRLFPHKRISVDGGISLDNLKLFRDIGVDSVCVGSRIFQKGVPEENYKQFTNKIKELEAIEPR